MEMKPIKSLKGCYVPDYGFESLQERIMRNIHKQSEEFYKRLLCEILGREADLEKDKGRIEIVQDDGHFPKVRKIYLDGIYKGYIKEGIELDNINFSHEYKIKFIPA